MKTFKTPVNNIKYYTDNPEAFFDFIENTDLADAVFFEGGYDENPPKNAKKFPAGYYEDLD